MNYDLPKSKTNSLIIKFRLWSIRGTVWKLAVGPKHHKILCATSAITLLLCSFVMKNSHALRRFEVWSKNGFYSHNASVKAIFALLRSEIIIVFGRFFAREHLLKVYPQQKIMEIQSQNFCSVLIAKKLFFFLGQFEDLVPTFGYMMLLLGGHISQDPIFSKNWCSKAKICVKIWFGIDVPDSPFRLKIKLWRNFNLAKALFHPLLLNNPPHHHKHSYKK